MSGTIRDVRAIDNDRIYWYNHIISFEPAWMQCIFYMK